MRAHADVSGRRGATGMARLAAALVGLLLAAPSAQAQARVLLGSDLTDGFYGQEPPFAVADAAWLGLLRTADGYALRSVALTWTPLERAPGADGPTFALAADPAGAIALFGGSSLASSAVVAADPWTTEVSTLGEAVEIRLGERSHRIGLESLDEATCSAVLALTDGSTTQRIRVEPGLGCGDPHFTVHWAGDLDGDGRLDLVATFAMKYSEHPRQLYLSTRAAPGELVGLAARTDRTAS